MNSPIKADFLYFPSFVCAMISLSANSAQFNLHFLVGNPFPPVFWLRLSSKITSCHTPCRCPNFSLYPTSLNPHFRCKFKLATFAEIISADIVQYFSFSDAANRALSKAEPIPCLCFSCFTCTLTSATPTYPQVLETGLSVAQP